MTILEARLKGLPLAGLAAPRKARQVLATQRLRERLRSMRRKGAAA